MENESTETATVLPVQDEDTIRVSEEDMLALIEATKD
jgi:hypothetical protein